MSLPSPPDDGEIGAGLEAGAPHRTWPSASRRVSTHEGSRPKAEAPNFHRLYMYTRIRRVLTGWCVARSRLAPWRPSNP